MTSKKTWTFCDIWRNRKPKCQNFTFRRKHSTGFIERRLDYIFISNCLQEFVNSTDVLPALSTVNSPVLISLSNDSSDNNGPGLWKFNSFIVNDQVHVENMKKLFTDYKY